MLHATSSTFHVGGTTFGGEDSGENDGEIQGGKNLSYFA